jgi:protease-4
VEFGGYIVLPFLARTNAKINMSDTQEVLKTLSEELVRERKLDRFWRNVRFFTVLGFGALVSLSSYQALRQGKADTKDLGDYVSLVRIEGEIGPNAKASAEKLNPLLEKAFSDKKAKGVVLVINSPGGTPVQSALIHDQIERLKKEQHKKVVVVGEDMLTSGAYFIAVAADKIFVNPSTVTGSIGVISPSFGFDRAMDKIGIERRVLTAGVSKSRLDPFSPMRAEDKEKLSGILSNLHQHFIDAVKRGRKNLTGDPASLFSGDFWTGDEAVKLGLVDGLAGLPEVLDKEFQVKDVREFAQPKGLVELIGGSVKSEIISPLMAHQSGFYLLPTGAQ